MLNAEHVWLMPAASDYGQVWGGYEPLALVGPSTTSWVHGEHLGTPVMLTSAAGASVNDMQAAPFGARFRTATASPKTAIAFPGQIIDIADRHYNMHRDYDPTLGRYLQADPIGLEGGDNLYGYVGGNPVTGMDPEGLMGHGAGQGKTMPPRTSACDYYAVQCRASGGNSRYYCETAPLMCNYPYMSPFLWGVPAEKISKIRSCLIDADKTAPKVSHCGPNGCYDAPLDKEIDRYHRACYEKCGVN